MNKLGLGLPASLVNAASAQRGTSPTRLLTTYYLVALLLIAVLVFAEKLLPYGQWTARIIGGALIGLALLVVARPDLAALLRGPAM